MPERVSSHLLTIIENGVCFVFSGSNFVQSSRAERRNNSSKSIPRYIAFLTERLNSEKMCFVLGRI